jgi:hypothetical protein
MRGRLRGFVHEIVTRVDRRWGWHRFPWPVGIAVLIGLRDRLRRHNLFDTSGEPTGETPAAPAQEARWATRRAPDGSHNDLVDPTMGMAGTRFGRNLPLDATHTDPNPLAPNPRMVSRELLTRHQLIPAESVNVLVAAWLQFMVRDWFSHGHSPTDRPWELPLEDGDDWPHGPLRVMRTPDDPSRPEDAQGRPRTWANTETHWWDASQLYGSSAEQQAELRLHEGGRLRVWPESLALPSDPKKDPRRVPGFWTGLALLQTLFAREHNAICEHLHAAYPSWADDELFEHARLITAALIAKIHTTEWTPAVISHPTTVAGMRYAWWGIVGEKARRVVGRIGTGELLTGIPGSRVNQHGAPFAQTEEFVAVYRMHPLAPDDYDLRTLDGDRPVRGTPFTLRELSGPGGLDVLGEVGLQDVTYSFGTAHPGLVTLHNFPNFLQEFVRPDGQGTVDLAATDVLRIRELGVPRYNDFRRHLGMAPVNDFSAIAPDAATEATLRRVYQDDIDAVDLLIGMYGEPRPKGFAFSDTAFRIFLLMAPRRLQSDRFFTTDYTPEVYTPPGLRWIDDNTMTTVLLRHFPRLRDTLGDVRNAFRPWRRTT